MENPETHSVERSYRSAVLVGGAMIGSLLLYAVLVEALPLLAPGFVGLGELTDASLDPLRYAMAGLAMGMALLIPFLRQIMLKRGQSPRGGAHTGTRAAAPPTSQRLSASILGLALGESVGVLGLVLFLLGGNRWDFYGFAGLSLLLLVVFFPRYSDWRD